MVPVRRNDQEIFIINARLGIDNVEIDNVEFAGGISTWPFGLRCVARSKERYPPVQRLPFNLYLYVFLYVCMYVCIYTWRGY